MKKIKHIIFALIFSLGALTFAAPSPVSAVNQDQGGGGGCAGGRVLTFPTWYRGLATEPTTCAVKLTQLNDIWKIVLNLVEIMMQVAG